MTKVGLGIFARNPETIVGNRRVADLEIRRPLLDLSAESATTWSPNTIGCRMERLVQTNELMTALGERQGIGRTQ